MQTKPQKHTLQPERAQGGLEFLINRNHELSLLVDKINWDKFE